MSCCRISVQCLLNFIKIKPRSTAMWKSDSNIRHMKTVLKIEVITKVAWIYCKKVWNFIKGKQWSNTLLTKISYTQCLYYFVQPMYMLAHTKSSLLSECFLFWCQYKMSILKTPHSSCLTVILSTSCNWLLDGEYSGHFSSAFRHQTRCPSSSHKRSRSVTSLMNRFYRPRDRWSV